MTLPTTPICGKDELRSLLALLTKSINSLINSDVEIPSLSSTDPVPLAMSAEVGTALAAVGQIGAVLEGPTAPGRLAMSYHVPSCIRAVIEAHVAEAIRERGDPVNGLHVDEIAKASNINPAKLARILRLLASQHIFRETSEDTFTNNRLSTALDTSKPLSSLISNPSFHTGTTGIQALMCHLTDECMKASAHLSEFLQDEALREDESPANTAFVKAFEMKEGETVFEWFGREENTHRRERFGWAMKGVEVIVPTGEFDVNQGFGFDKLSEGANVVDVGGGVGSVSLAVTKAFPALHVVLQDQKAVIEGEASALWAKEDPSALSSGRVTLQSHDFFQPQPVVDAAVFLLRFVIHDWAESRSIEILSHLRKAATEETKLILVEQLVQPLCPPELIEEVPVAPEPLLPTGGASMTYFTDIHMMMGMNAQERTLAQYRALGHASGWQLVATHKSSASALSQLVFAPA